MPGAKLIVMYPLPKNPEQFEKVYHNEHVPMAVEKLSGKTKIVATKILGLGAGPSEFHRIAEIHFPSIEILKACAASQGGRQVLENAIAISTGGEPVILIAEEETFNFGR
ncbi:MAG TPA: EthD family reductase [Terriglobales bacterium]|nr:EthD family reductase [Terriglobales bacterium]